MIRSHVVVTHPPTAISVMTTAKGKNLTQQGKLVRIHQFFSRRASISSAVRLAGSVAIRSRTWSRLLQSVDLANQFSILVGQQFNLALLVGSGFLCVSKPFIFQRITMFGTDPAADEPAHGADGDDGDDK